MAVIMIVGMTASTPAIMAKKHHHLTDTQKEDSTTSDAQGNTCNFGPHHDECRDQFLQSKGFAPLKSDEHFGECQPGEGKHEGDTDCEIVNDNDPKSFPLDIPK